MAEKLGTCTTRCGALKIEFINPLLSWKINMNISIYCWRGYPIEDSEGDSEDIAHVSNYQWSRKRASSTTIWFEWRL